MKTVADVTMPQLGESVTEGTLGKWLKQVGDTVTKYEPLVEVVTDKVNAEVPSDFEGTLTEILVQEGQTVKVGTVLCRVSAEGEAPSAQAPSQTPEQREGSSEPTQNRAVSQIPANRPRFSPAVLRIAEEKGIDLSQVTGTGEGGRITRKDVLNYVAGPAPSMAAPAQTASAAIQAVVSTRPAEDSVTAPAQASAPVSGVDVDEEVIQPSPVRKTIAKKMVESKHNAPHAWTTVESDVTRLAAFRDQVKKDFKRKEGIDLTYLPFFIKATVEALKQYPMVNSAWVNDEIHVKKRINISIAVATDDALVVPVIHDADRLSIAGIAHAVNELAAKARSGKLTVADVQGGTFTVNNTGAFGSILSQPIINAPQAAIMSVESIVKRPVVVDDAIAIRSMVNLSLSLDHRVLDGWISGQFLKAVKTRLQAFDHSTVLY
jgi:2-oxoisovalerate dehydrogenase E2 component (dihydrolipoyl transacylase)